MNVKSLAIGIVSFAIMGLMLVSVLVPVLSEGINSNKTTFSNGDETRFYVEDRSNEVVEVSYGAAGLTFNDVSIPLNRAAPYILTESGTFTYSSSNSRMYFLSDEHYFVISAADLVYDSGTVTGTVTASDTTYDVSEVYEHAYFYSVSKTPLGILQAATDSVLYFHEDSQLLSSAGINGVGSLMLTGTLEDPHFYVNGVETEATISINQAPIEGYSDVVSVTGYISVSWGDSDSPQSVSFSRFLGEVYVLGEKEENKTIDTIIQIIPLLVGAGLVVMAVRYFLLSRE